MSELLAQIKATHFTAGIVMTDDVVIEAAPIIKYMRGWTRAAVRNYCNKKRWKISVVSEL